MGRVRVSTAICGMGRVRVSTAMAGEGVNGHGMAWHGHGQGGPGQGGDAVGRVEGGMMVFCLLTHSPSRLTNATPLLMSPPPY